MSINNGTVFSEGYATLPLSDYNALLAKVASVNSMISVKKGWAGAIEVEVNAAGVYSIGINKLDEYCKVHGILVDDYKVTKLDDFYVSSATIANKKPEEDNQ